MFVSNIEVFFALLQPLMSLVTLLTNSEPTKKFYSIFVTIERLQKAFYTAEFHSTSDANRKKGAYLNCSTKS